MSVIEMIKDHPDVKESGENAFNPALGELVRHSMYCSAICASCADACLAEEAVATMRQCIRACLDCADVCEATSKVSLRRAGRNVPVMRAQIEACIAACEACAAECEKHENPHCARCAKMCRETADDARKALPTVK